MDTNDNPKPVYSRRKIRRRVSALARRIEKDGFDLSNAAVLCIMTGGFMFAADLVRRFTDPALLRIGFIWPPLRSSDTTDEHGIRSELDGGLRSDFRKRHLLIVDGTEATGTTLKRVKAWAETELEPLSIKAAVLMYLHGQNMVADYVVFKTRYDAVGYGENSIGGGCRCLPDLWDPLTRRR